MPKFNPKSSTLTKIFFIFWFVYFLVFWSRAVYFDQVGNFVAGHVNVWGDWAAHFTMATAMAERGLLLANSPFLVGARFSYPFVSDLLSAVLYRFSDNLIYSFLVPSFLLSLFFVWSIYYFFKTLWQSERKALLSSLVFLLNGGAGFYYYFKDNLSHSGWWKLLIKPLHEVTRFDEHHIKWISIIDSMVIPQRAFLLGFPLTILALTLIYQYFFLKKNQASQWKISLSAAILGLMPIIHTHSFLAAFIILSFWCLEDLLNGFHRKQTWKVGAWFRLAFGTGILSIPIFVYYFFGQVDHGFSQFFPGWLAKTYGINWFIFWWKNWLFVPWLAILGFFLLAKKNLKKIMIFSPFVFIFAIANLFLFQPFAWDNTKLFVWASLGFAYLFVYVLWQIWNKPLKLPLANFAKAVIVIGVFLLSILSGTLDLHYIIRHDLHNYVMYTKEEWELAQWVRKNTPKKSLWLTGDRHNHPIFNLTGRQTIFTYRGWLWTHGYDYLQIEKDISNFYQHPLDQLDFLSKYPVSYIIIGENERTVWKANEEEFIEHFKLLKQTRTYKIFESKYN